MSKTVVPLNIVSALVKAEEILGKDRVWTPTSPAQETFLANFFGARNELAAFNEKELRAWVDFVAENLNSILKAEGFDIRLEEFATGEFGVISILDILVEWFKEGRVTKVTGADKRQYPAVQFSVTENTEQGRLTLFEAYTSHAHPHPIAKLPTKSGDVVHITIAEREASGFDLTAAIDRIRSGVQQREHFEILRYPMIDFNASVTLDWLLGLSTTNERCEVYEVSQALQQTKFKMNQFGARLKDAVAIAMRLTTATPRQPTVLEINRPFLFWIERPGVRVPVMYAYFDESDWKDPGDLGSI